MCISRNHSSNVSMSLIYTIRLSLIYTFFKLHIFPNDSSVSLAKAVR